MLTYNIFDAIGKAVPTLVDESRLPSTRAFWWATLGRALMLGIFLLALPGNILGSDDLLVVVMAIFAGSNGIIACAALVLAPPRVSVEERELAGTIMVFFLTLGLLTGVLIGDLFAFVVQS
jgi:solute carrier family 29 (equilibrative nucleoside transporter), member 1/2/3